MPPPWAAVAELRVVGRIHGSETNNVFHLATNLQVFDPNSNLSQLLLDLVTAMRQCVRDTLLPAVSQDWTFERCSAHVILPQVSDPVEVSGVPGDVGQRGPTSVAFASSLVSVRTGVGGRRGRGRKFFPPAGEADITDSRLNDAVLALLALYIACVAEKFMGANPTSNWTYVVLSKSDLNALGGNMNNATRPVVGLSPRADVASMVSRKVGRGA